MKKFLTALLTLATCLSLRAAEQTLTYPDLVKRLTDLEYLATLPTPGEQCAQWSSYDRKSTYNEATGKYANWDANGDGGGALGKDQNEIVMAEMKGPGCIWRIWSARPQQGHVRIYLDGATEPAVDLPFMGYFDSKNEPFTRTAIVHEVGKGFNNYTPIPYQTSCRIVADQSWGMYFHFTYGTFPRGTKVPTFKRQLEAADLAALDRANAVLNHCGFGAGQKRTGDKQWSSVVKAPAGKTVAITKLKGPRAITGIRVKLDGLASPADIDVLRELALQITWDGEATPSVWAPLGDFFGTAPGVNPYDSLALGMGKDGWWYCNWYMPFGQEARLELINDGKTPRNVSFEVVHAPLTQPIAQLARFHAKWHRDAFLPQEPERWIDWPMLKTEGAGRFVGVMLHVWNPRGGWWGEGDEKFFVDGEKFPSTFGTGSEDYFGYAWSDPGLFQNAFHNQTRNDGRNKGHVSVNRWHVADAVPFQKAFEGCIEKYYPNQRPALYAGMAYWYLAPGGNDPYRPVPVEDRVGYWLAPLEPFKVQGALEGEKLKVLGKTAGGTQAQGMTDSEGDWSNDSQLQWTGAKPGDKLDLALPVRKAGKYKLGVHLTKGPGYGIVQLYLDGQKMGAPVDLFRKVTRPTGSVVMGEQDLTAGEHKLTVEIVGASDKGTKAYLFGLDCVMLDPL